MKITVKTEEFLDALNKVKLSIYPRTTLDILRNVKLSAFHNKLLLLTTDLECALQVEIPAKIDRGGAVCLPIKELLELVKNIEAKKLSLELKPKKDNERAFVITGDNTEVRIPGRSPEDYPPIPGILNGIRVAFANIGQTLSKIAYAMTPDVSRPVLNGICLRQTKRKILAAAADGFRLSTIEISGKGKIDSDLIIPMATVNIIRKLFPDDAVMIVEPSPEKKHPDDTVPRPRILLRRGNLTLISQLIDGTYPKYEQLIPTKNTHKVEFAKKDMLKAFQTINAMHSDKPVILTAAGGKMKVSQALDVGAVTVNLKAKGTIQIGVELRYLQEILQSCSETVAIKTSASSSPLLIQEGAVTHVLMPRFCDFNKRKTPIKPEDILPKPSAVPETIEQSGPAEVNTAKI
ncbi:MAG: DNA polymerase III subunit beta [Candidatus Marinimicrobia bacterium]|jgi:DNA polymerase-3 subunit beta|nr:DNA polymerase III subunit beta [Candidatus Neomarinimicrobiota bacterium]